MASSSSQSTLQAQSTGSQIDASVAAASLTATALLTQSGEAHALIGGQAVRLLGSTRKTLVRMEARQVDVRVKDYAGPCDCIKVG